MDSFVTFLQQQVSLIPPSAKYVSLINDSNVGPVRLMEELERLHRQVQCISLDAMEAKDLSLLPDVIDDFLNTGFDVVLTISSSEVLNANFDLLVDWKNRYGGKNKTFGDKKIGMLFLLLNYIDRNEYQMLLQNLVDFELPADQEEQT